MTNTKFKKINDILYLYRSNKLSVSFDYRYVNNDKPAILLFYGFGGSAKMMQNITPILAEHFSTIVIDYPGHSASPPDYNYTIIEFIDVVKEILDILEIKKIYLIGYSFGGIVALEYYKRYKDQTVKFIFLHSTPSFSFNPFYKILYKIIKIFLSIHTFFVVTKILIPILADKNFTKEQYGLALDLCRKNDSKSIVYMYDRIVYENFYSLADNLDLPVLIIGSRKDILVVEKESIKLSEKIKNSKLIILNDFGHLSIVTASEHVSELIIDFLR